MFYLTLPSNASYSVFPRNTASVYKTQLSEPIELEGDWEVGLVEISYSKSWNSIPENEYVIVDEKKFCIYEGQYSSFADLFRYLNDDIKVAKEDKEIDKKVRFRQISGKITIDNPHECEVKISKKFGEMMGFDVDKPTDYKFVGNEIVVNDSVKSKYPADVQHGIHQLFVYCNVIEPQIVGDYKVPLLRIVPVGKGDVVTKYFHNIYYFPVLTKKFQTIEINIKDTTGEDIRFQHGTSYVVLHFRKRV